MVFEEIHLHADLTNSSNGKYPGYVDLGFGEPSDNDSQPLAKKAMVFMLVCLNGRWKLQLAYFLVDSIDSRQLSVLVTRALQLVDDCGAIVWSITSDGIGIN